MTPSFATRFDHLIGESSHGDPDDAAAVVTPRTAEDVAEVVRHAAHDGLSVCVEGSGSTGRSAPWPPCDIVISTGALDRVIAYESADLTLVVGAGTTLGAIDDTLSDHRQSAVLLESDDDRTIGGVVSSGDSGYRRLRYGPTRDRILGVTIVTGYGEIVKGGGRLVKNVTGYDLPRLVTGAHGSLGVVVDVCLKLWPHPQRRAMVAVTDPAQARSSVHRPAAVLETEGGAHVHLEGSEPSVEAAVHNLGASAWEADRFPEPITSPFGVSIRVPPRSLRAALDILSGRHPDRFVTQHGVGRIDAGWGDLDEGSLGSLRSAISGIGGVVVVTAWATNPVPERWGVVPGGISIQRRLKHLFDPAGILNLGHLPGGL